MKYSLSLITLSILLFCSLAACKKSNVAPAIETTNDTIAAQINSVPMVLYSIEFSAYARGSNSEFDIIGSNDTQAITLHVLNYHGVGAYPLTGSVSNAYFQDSATIYTATS
ncbi:MAG: hypothetical protein JSS96_16340, partial [Bacteroidetes bacterium]|nr:hypothetical protein [Bacteroidota bacterium]